MRASLMASSTSISILFSAFLRGERQLNAHVILAVLRMLLHAAQVTARNSP